MNFERQKPLALKPIKHLKNQPTENIRLTDLKKIEIKSGSSGDEKRLEMKCGSSGDGKNWKKGGHKKWTK